VTIQTDEKFSLLLRERQGIIRSTTAVDENGLEGNISVNLIAPIQQEVILELPELFNQGYRFYKMHPRHKVPNKATEHVLAREFSYYRHCLSKVEIDGLWAEFGTFEGTSARYLTSLKKELYPDSKELFYGFDSFEGLPEEWTGEGTKKGGLSAEGKIPQVDGARFIKGWFKDTIPKFIKDYDKPCALLHIDSDIYSSAVDVLESLQHKIIPGTVIMFDELIGYNAWKLHEYKAFIEFVEKYEVEYEWLAYVVNSAQAACKITKKNI